MTVLREELPGQIWVQERNLWFGGVQLRSRSTIVKMSGGALWVHSPGPPTAEICRELEAIGEVAWIVVPNRFHHLHAAALKKKYPGAKLVGPSSVRTRNREVIVEHDLADPSLGAKLPGFRIVPLAGVPFLDETTFFHEPSQTLIATDLMMCGGPKDHWTWRWASRIWGQYRKLKLPPDVRMRTRRGKELSAALDEMMKLPIARILVAHSDPIEERPVEQLGAAWRFALRQT